LPEDVLRVRLLEVPRADLLRRDVGCQGEHRHARALGVVQPVDQVQVPRTAGARAHRESAGHRGLGGRGERRGLLVARDHPVHCPGLADRVGDPVERIAGHAVDALHPGVVEGVDDVPCDGVGTCGHGPTLRPVDARRHRYSGRASTSAPAGNSVTSAGISASTSARAIVATRCEPAPETGSTVGRSPSTPGPRTARRYCVRPAGDDTAPVSRPRTARTGSLPTASSRSGRSRTTNETSALTGLPGRQTTGVSRQPARPCGPPGCIATGPNLVSALPPSTWRTTSAVPIDTAPAVSTRSASVQAESRAAANSCGSSPLVMLVDTVHPHACSAADSVTALDSQIWPGPSGRPGGTSSAPVAITPTRGRGRTSRPETPSEAAAARCRSAIRTPAGSTRSPSRTSSPGLRTNSPADRGRSTRTASPSTSVSSTGITQSAPDGTAAPVITLRASSSSTSWPGSSPALVVPTTCSRTGEPGPAPAKSAARTA